MGEYRQKLIADLELRHYSDRTVENYVGSVRRFVAHYMRSPTELGAAEIRQYLLYQKENKLSASTRNRTVSALKFFYRTTLGRPEDVEAIPHPKVPKTLHDTLSRPEVDNILASVASTKHRTILMAVYGAGLRISEACSLKFGDIDRQQHVIHVRGGKGNKDRYVMLGERLLAALVAYYLAIRPAGPYFFAGNQPDRPLSRKVPSTALRKACDKAGIRKRVTTHSLRHAFATHLLEDGVDVRVIQLLLGHSSIRTTAIYTQVTPQHIAQIKSPLDTEASSKTPPR
jgi:site-specific recombinase XerD